MKNLFILLTLSTAIFASQPKEYIDLGTEGHVYKITEKSFMKDIEEAVAETQKEFDQGKVKKEVIKQIRSQATGHTNLPLCQESRKRAEYNYIPILQDIYNPAGRLIRKKGDKVLVNNDIPFDICFISGNNKEEIDNQIKFYDKITKKLSGKNSECIYMVSNRNVLQLDKKYYPRMFYPTGKGYEETFNVSCYPTLIHLENDKRFIFETPMDKFKHKKER